MIEKYAKEIAIKLLGEPNKKLSRPDELRYGSYGSLSIDVKKGVVFNHEENCGYGLVELIKKHGHDPKKFLDDMGINDKKPEISKSYEYDNRGDIYDTANSISSQANSFDGSTF